MNEPRQPSIVPASLFPLRRPLLVIGMIALAAAAVGVFLARRPFDLTLLLPIFMICSIASTLLRWSRREDRRTEAVYHLRSAVEEYGGGFYGTVGFSTWAYLELLALRADWSTAGGFADFLSSRSLEWLLGFGIDSIMNAIRAAVWPLHWVRELGFWPMAVGAAIAWGIYQFAVGVAALRRIAALRSMDPHDPPPSP